MHFIESQICHLRRGTAHPAATTGAVLLWAVAGAVALPSASQADTHGACVLSDPAAEVSDADAAMLYDCLKERMQAQIDTLDAGGEVEGQSWVLSDRPEARDFLSYPSVTRAPYTSGTHGGRYVVNLADADAMPSYSQFEDGGPMPVGAILAKPSFVISDAGEAQLGPLFLMEKAEEDAFPDTSDWIYTVVTPTGGLMGRTGGQNSGGMQFCADCHMGMASETDSMTYLPEAYRVSN